MSAVEGLGHVYIKGLTYKFNETRHYRRRKHLSSGGTRLKNTKGTNEEFWNIHH